MHSRPAGELGTPEGQDGSRSVFLSIDLGPNHGRRVVERISVDEALSEPLLGDLVGADAREPMAVRGRLADAAEREPINLAAASDRTRDFRTSCTSYPTCRKKEP